MSPADKRHALAVLHRDVGPTLAQEMKNDHVPGAVRKHGRERWRELARLRRHEAPGLGTLRVEVDGRVEPDDPENLRERVHRREAFLSQFGRLGNESGTAGQGRCARWPIGQTNRTPGQNRGTLRIA